MIPVILVTGFLGAGKTTVINRLIAHFSGRVARLAVMINEFASIGIDGALVAPGDYVKIELNKGSIFCSCMRSDFIAELKKLAIDVQPDLLLIEATGIARVDDLYGMMRLDGLDTLIRLQKNICVVDAKNFFKVEQTLEAAGVQVEYADTIILNKIDQAEDGLVDRTLKLIAHHNDTAPVYHALFGDFSPELVFAGSLAEQPESVEKITPGFDHKRASEFFSCSLKLDGIINADAWKVFIASLPDTMILRAKGIIRFPGGLRYYEIINGEYSEKEVPPLLAARQQSIFTFVSHDQFPADFLDRLRACATVVTIKLPLARQSS